MNSEHRVIDRRALLAGGAAAVMGAGLTLTLTGGCQAVGAGAALTMLRDARVFDGERVHPRASVLIADGLISAVAERVDPPAGTQVIDAAGKTVLPGLIDAHTHAFPDSLGQALVFGVTTELDMFADPILAAELKRAAATRYDLADLRTAGIGATAPGGHPTRLVEQGVYPPFPTIDSTEQAEAFVADRAAEGSDYLKIIMDDGDALGYPQPTLAPDTVAALIAHAHQQGLLAIVHALDAAAARHALASGADGLAHLVIDTEDAAIAKLGAQQNAFVTPTLVVLEAVSGRGHGARLLSDPKVAPFLNQTSQTMLGLLGGNIPIGPGAHVNYDAATATLQHLRHAGVTILAGTDAGNIGVAHGASIHRELQLLVAAGLTPPEALRAATSAPADRFGLSDRGRVQAGLAADLLLVDGDPTTTITDTLNISAIWRRGVRVDRESTTSTR